ncbi:M20_dimer domain-containing protein [Psidium guajava]|nr:M20_dimer domain-containing protein [Psidium guajava]
MKLISLLLHYRIQRSSYKGSSGSSPPASPTSSERFLETAVAVLLYSEPPPHRHYSMAQFQRAISRSAAEHNRFDAFALTFNCSDANMGRSIVL